MVVCSLNQSVQARSKASFAHQSCYVNLDTCVSTHIISIKKQTLDRARLETTNLFDVEGKHPLSMHENCLNSTLNLPYLVLDQKLLSDPRLKLLSRFGNLRSSHLYIDV